MLSRLSQAAAAAARAGGGGFAPAILAARGYATQLSRSLVFDQHGSPERVLRLTDQVLPQALGDHDVLINLLAVSWRCRKHVAPWGAASFKTPTGSKLISRRR